MSGVIKITGLVVLMAGILGITGTLYYSFKIFTGAVSVPKVFSEEDLKRKDAGSVPEEGADPEENMENMVRRELDNQFKKIAPPSVIAKLLNLLTWSIFAGIATLAGGKIAGIGLSMLRSKNKNE